MVFYINDLNISYFMKDVLHWLATIIILLLPFGIYMNSPYVFHMSLYLLVLLIVTQVTNFYKHPL